MELNQKTITFVGKNGLTNIKALLNQGEVFLSKSLGFGYATDGSLVSTSAIKQWCAPLPSSDTPSIMEFSDPRTIIAGSQSTGNLYVAASPFTGSPWTTVTGTYTKPAAAWTSIAGLNGAWYAVNKNAGGTTMVKLNSSTATTAADVATHPPMTQLRTFNNRLYGWSETTNPNTLNWSNLLDGTDWASGSAGSLDLKTVWPDPNEAIRDITVFNNCLIVFGIHNIAIFDISGSVASVNVTYAISLREVIKNIGLGYSGTGVMINTGFDVFIFNQASVYSISRLIQTNGSLPASQTIQQYTFFSPYRTFFNSAIFDPSTNKVYVSVTQPFLTLSGTYNFGSVHVFNLKNQGLTDGGLIPFSSEIPAVYSAGAVTQGSMNILFPKNLYNDGVPGSGTNYGFIYNHSIPMYVNAADSSQWPQFATVGFDLVDSTYTFPRIFATGWLNLNEPERFSIVKKVSFNLRRDVTGYNYSTTLDNLTLTVNIYTDYDSDNVKATSTYTFSGTDNLNPPKSIGIPIGGYGKIVMIEVVTNVPGLIFDTMSIDYQTGRTSVF